jgi:hypothetical protein
MNAVDAGLEGTHCLPILREKNEEILHAGL